MARTFNCPSCGAPLEPDGSSTTVRCSYCSASVIVPPELREPEPTGVTFTSVTVNGAQVYPSGSPVSPMQMQDIVLQIRAGNKINAIKIYREATGAGLKESKDFVDVLEKLLSLSGSETPEELADLFARSQASAGSVEPSPTASSGISKILIALIVLGIAAAIIVPIVLSIIIPAVAITSAVKQVDVVETVQYDIRTAVFNMLTPTPAPTPGFASLLLSFGGEGISPGQFKDARNVAVGRDGKVYVAEYTGGRVQVFDPQGKFLSQFRVDAKMPVLGMGVDRQGVVYISQGGDITRYDPETGEALGKFSALGASSYGDLTFSPTGQIAVASISAQNPDDIVILDSSGKVVRTIPGAFSGQTGDPELDMTLAFDGLGNLYALGSFNMAVLKFSPEGKFINRFGSRGNEPGQFRSVQGLAVDGQGRVYVGNIGEIQVFDDTGRYLDKINRQETVYFGLAPGVDGSLWAAGRTMVYQFRPKTRP